MAEALRDQWARHAEAPQQGRVARSIAELILLTRRADAVGTLLKAAREVDVLETQYRTLGFGKKTPNRRAPPALPIGARGQRRYLLEPILAELRAAVSRLQIRILKRITRLDHLINRALTNRGASDRQVFTAMV